MRRMQNLYYTNRKSSVDLMHLNRIYQQCYNNNNKNVSNRRMCCKL